MKEYLFVIKRNGNDKNGNALYHVYGANRKCPDGGELWNNLSHDSLAYLDIGRVKGEYITTNISRSEIIKRVEDVYNGMKCSFLFL